MRTERMTSVAKMVAELDEASCWMTGSSEVVVLYLMRSIVCSGFSVLVETRS
jgi:hypothetical protein